MKQTLILSLAIASLAAAAAAQQQAEPAPKAEREVRVIRDARVVGNVSAPYVVAVQRGFFGISTLDLTAELLEHFGVDADGGVLISSVAEDGPAERAGLRVGDILVEVDGEPIESRFDASVVIGRLEPESKVYAKVYRGGREQTLEVTVGEHKRGQVPLNWVVDDHHRAPSGHAYQFHFQPDPDLEEVLVFNTEDLEETIERMRERLHSPEYSARIEAFRDRNAELEVRLQEMERRLEEMGARLAEALAQIHDRVGDD